MSQSLGALPDASKIPAIPSDLATHYTHIFAGICITLIVLATITFGARLWTRCYPVFKMAADDYVCTCAFVSISSRLRGTQPNMLMAQVFVLVDSSIYLCTVRWVFIGTKYSLTLADMERAYFYAIIGQPFWAWSMATTKCAVALMLLRLQQNKGLRRFLWIMIALQVIVAIYNMVTQLLQCVPLNKAWDLLGIVPGKCWSKEAIRASSIAVQVFHIITDWIFALLPISFLRRVQRPFRERVVIGILMALGIFAGAASLVKIVALANFGRTNDPTAESIQIGMWSCIEELVAFVAACIPCLRSLFQRTLEYFGLVSTNHPSAYAPNRYGQMYGQSTPAKHTRSRRSHSGIGSALRMQSEIGADAQSEEHILTGPGEDVKSGEIWCMTEIQVEEEQTKRKTGLGDGRSNASWSEENAQIKDNGGK